MIVNDLLVSSFPNIVDFNFTAKMEDELDEIAKGKMKWATVIKSFYGPFDEDLNNAQTNVQKIIIKSEEKCPECGKEMVVKSSRYGKFLACSNYPECKGKKSLNAVKDNGKQDASSEEVPAEPCPVCGKTMIVKAGRYGKFYACPDYPKCTGKKALSGRKSWHKTRTGGDGAEKEASDEKCPECGSPMVLKYGRFGKFLACSKYPECKTTKKIYRYSKSKGSKSGDSDKGNE
jgi:DNA topoisomerase-1